jgi:hypothetical protein
MKQVRTSWPAHGWSWDTRLTCAASSFDVDHSAKARAAAATMLTTEWTSATIPQAPSAVRVVAERSGGLRAGQLLFVSTSVDAGFAYGLWWPWGNQKTISMRIGLGGYEPREDALERLRNALGVAL